MKDAKLDVIVKAIDLMQYTLTIAPACVFNPKNLKLHRQVQMVEVEGEDY